MKVKMSLIIAAARHIGELAMQELPGHIALRVVRVRQALAKENEAYGKTYMALIDKHKGEFVDGAPPKFQTEKAKAAFEADLQPVLDEEIDIDLAPIPVSVIENLDTITPRCIEAIEWLLGDDSGEKDKRQDAAA